MAWGDGVQSVTVKRRDLSLYNPLSTFTSLSKKMCETLLYLFAK